MKRLAAIFIAVVFAVAAGGAPPSSGARPDGARSDGLGPPGENYLSGQLLVASPSLKGRIFGQTVILMFRHDATGAFGVILNRPVEKRSLGELMRNFGVDGVTPTPEREITVHFGGPVSKQMAVVVHSNDFTHPNSIRITDFASAISPREFLRAMAEGKGPRRSVFAVGYAGWGPGQLEGELAEGSWVVAAPDRKFVFDKAYSTMWRRALERRFRDL